MPTTVGRSRGRQGVHSGAQGAAGDHMPKIMATLITAVVVLVAVLVLTKAGRDIDAATQRFMLYYAGVLALVGLTGSVLLGLLATDRIVMTPGHRVMAQAVHRAFSFGTLAFLIIHIVTEILAQRSHVIDAVVPFLSPYRTFYIGLGTIASDLIVLLVVTSIVRKRFTEHGKAWRWRAIHYASYVAFVFAVLHGLLGGRTAKPYVDWSYGFAIAVTALGLAVRFLAISLRPKESLPSSPSADRARPAGSSPLHAAAHGPGAGPAGRHHRRRRAGAAGRPGRPGCRGLVGRAPGAGLVAGLRPAARPGPRPGLRRVARGRLPRPRLHPAGCAAVRRRWLGRDAGSSLRVRGPGALGAVRARPAAALRARVRRTAPVRGRAAGTRRHTSGRAVLLPVRTAGPQARVAVRRGLPGPSGSGPRGTRPGMAEPAHPRAALPAPPRPGDRNSGPMPQLRTGPMPQPGPGPTPPPDTGPLPRAGQGLPPRNGMGPGTGPMPRAGTGPMPRAWAPVPCRAWAPARCPVRIPARCRGLVRGSRRVTGWVRVRDRCRVRARVPCRAWAPARAPTRAPCRAWARARRPGSTAVPMPVRCPGQTRCRASGLARCASPAPARCRVQAPARCPAQVPCPVPISRCRLATRPPVRAPARRRGLRGAGRTGPSPLTRDIARCRGRPEVTSGNEPDQGP